MVRVYPQMHACINRAQKHRTRSQDFVTRGHDEVRLAKRRRTDWSSTCTSCCSTQEAKHAYYLRLALLCPPPPPFLKHYCRCTPKGKGVHCPSRLHTLPLPRGHADAAVLQTLRGRREGRHASPGVTRAADRGRTGSDVRDRSCGAVPGTRLAKRRRNGKPLLPPSPQRETIAVDTGVPG